MHNKTGSCWEIVITIQIIIPESLSSWAITMNKLHKICFLHFYTVISMQLNYYFSLSLLNHLSHLFHVLDNLLDTNGNPFGYMILLSTVFSTNINIYQQSKGYFSCGLFKCDEKSIEHSHLCME